MVKEPDQHGTEGATLIAAAGGTVDRSFWHDNGGNVVQLDHGGGYFTTYILVIGNLQVPCKPARLDLHM
ncbi:peptidoglycan DD-metalloendopeptidase family protein [Nonomuraea sp. JJY05]|jgi:hypothetical protein|uniref:peptidoglycan DD-metalloendopeptidase family protein n=1 Tax=Nonomuraea sp. JJY05 TaxID=3350255 RepID=UPI00373F46D4